MPPLYVGSFNNCCKDIMPVLACYPHGFLFLHDISAPDIVVVDIGISEPVLDVHDNPDLAGLIFAQSKS